MAEMFTRLRRCGVDVFWGSFVDEEELGLDVSKAGRLHPLDFAQSGLAQSNPAVAVREGALAIRRGLFPEERPVGGNDRGKPLLGEKPGDGHCGTCRTSILK